MGRRTRRIGRVWVQAGAQRGLAAKKEAAVLGDLEEEQKEEQQEVEKEKARRGCHRRGTGVLHGCVAATGCRSSGELLLTFRSVLVVLV